MATGDTELINQNLRKHGSRMFTAAQLQAMEEHYWLLDPALTNLMNGTVYSGWRWKIEGNNGTGKTSLAVNIALSNYLAFPDRQVIYFDNEHALDAKRMLELGWPKDDPRMCVVPWDGNGEEMFDLIYSWLVGLVPISCIVFDSIHAILPKAQQDKDSVESAAMAPGATMFSKACRKIVTACTAARITQVFLAQERSDPSRQGAPVRSIGRALDFYADIRLTLTGGAATKTGQLFEEGVADAFGSSSTATLTKKKKGYAIPQSEQEIWFGYSDHALDSAWSMSLVLNQVLPIKAGRLVVPLGTASAAIQSEIGDSEGGTKSAFAVDKDTLLIRGPGDKPSDRRRILETARLIRTSPTLEMHLVNMQRAQYVQHTTIHPGEFAYPTMAELQAMVKSAGEIADV